MEKMNAGAISQAIQVELVVVDATPIVPPPHAEDDMNPFVAHSVADHPPLPPPSSSSSNSFGIGIAVSESSSAEAEPSSDAITIRYSRFGLTLRLTSILQWFIFLLLHVIVFSWLLSIHLAKDSSRSNRIPPGGPIIEGLLLAAWMSYVVAMVVKTFCAQQRRSIVDPLSEGAGVEVIHSPSVAVVSDSSCWQSEAAGIDWGRYARLLFLTVCVGVEALVAYGFIMGTLYAGLSTGSAAGSDIPGFLLFLMFCLNPFSWFMAHKYS